MRKDRENPGQPSCNRCGGMHFGSYKCPYLDQSQCHNCGGVIAAEEGSDYQVHPNRKFDSLGFAYHPSCEFLKEKITMQPHQQRVVDEKTELVASPCPCCLRTSISFRCLSVNRRETEHAKIGELYPLEKAKVKRGT